MSSPTATTHESFTDPRVDVETYVVRPTGYDDFVHPQKSAWRLLVTRDPDGDWSIRPGTPAFRVKLDADGNWVSDTDRGPRPRLCWPLAKAMTIALKHVDTHTWMESTAFEADATHRARRTPPPDGWTTELDGRTFPFVADEHGFITGYGHQHRGEFAGQVNRFLDATGTHVDEDDRCIASHVSWLLAVFDPSDDETLRTELDGKPVTWSTPGAFPITAVWHLT